MIAFGSGSILTTIAHGVRMCNLNMMIPNRQPHSFGKKYNPRSEILRSQAPNEVHKDKSTQQVLFS